MSKFFSEIVEALGTETGPDELLEARARIAELEAEVATLKRKEADRKDEYYKWLLRNRTGFVPSEQLVCALELQGTDPSTVTERAVAIIEALKDVAGGLAAASDSLIPAHAPSYWSNRVSDEETTFNNLEGDVVSHHEEWLGEVDCGLYEVIPVWHGRSRYVVVQPIYSEAEREEDVELVDHKVHVFATHAEARAFIDQVEDQMLDSEAAQ